MRRIAAALAAAALPALGFLGGPGSAAALPGAAPGEPIVLTSRAFGEPATLAVAELPAERAEAALRAGFARLQQVEELLTGAAERLEAGSQEERTVEVEPLVADLLARALEFCVWSEAAHGPLGGGLAAHWRAAAGNPAPPPAPAALTASAACERLELDRARGTARIAAGSRVDLSGFAAGFAVDRTVETLRDEGAVNGLVRVGRIERAFGPGPAGREGRGWPVALPVFEGYTEPLAELDLRDRALALVWRADWPADRPLHFDQRSGLPPGGVWAAAAVTELAVDAQALSVAALVLGAREGRFRMANLRPEPSVLWLLGKGTGRPLLTHLNWSVLSRP